eukprot:c30948_g1_i1 orf=47-262(-)
MGNLLNILSLLCEPMLTCVYTMCETTQSTFQSKPFIVSYVDTSHPHPSINSTTPPSSLLSHKHVYFSHFNM